MEKNCANPAGDSRRRRYFVSERPFVTRLGYVFPSLTIAYNTFGTLSEKRDNVVWVCHALTADSDVSDWWPHTVEPGAFLDPSRHFVVCANIIGSHYGSTGPLSLNPATGTPYYKDFPKLTVADWVEAHKVLADHLDIGGIHTLVGSSVGGFQALEWAASEPERFAKLILIATDAYASPWTIAIDETQRMAIRADSTYGLPSPDAGKRGLAAARALGLLTYRGSKGYNRTQADPADADLQALHRAVTYQQYQGEKLCRRFDAYSYMSILDTFDTHDIGRGRGGIGKALSAVKARAIVVGISSDIIFTPDEMKALSDMLPCSEYHEIDSPFGHDGFLVEHRQLNDILYPFINDTEPPLEPTHNATDSE